MSNNELLLLDIGDIVYYNGNEYVVKGKRLTAPCYFILGTMAKDENNETYWLPFDFCTLKN